MPTCGGRFGRASTLLELQRVRRPANASRSARAVEVLLDSLRALEMSFGDLWTPDIASGKLTRPYQHLEECAVLCCAGGVPGRLVPRAGAADRPEVRLT